MKLPRFIAIRYLFSKKKINAINVINGIAMTGFGVGAFAMVVILSVFNGFEDLVAGLINNYDPDIKITSNQQKVFVPTDELLTKITTVEGVENVAESLEEKVVVKYNERQEIAKIKGVNQAYQLQGLDSLLVVGSQNIQDTSQKLALFGAGLASRLGAFPGSNKMVTVFVPRRNVEYNSLNPEASLSMDFIRPSGVFMVHEEIDNEVFITNLQFASSLLDYPNSITSYEIHLATDSDPEDVRDEIIASLGSGWDVKTREEQNELLYKIFRSEKWFTYAILSLVLLISAFNIFGSLIMLVLDKKEDISILKSMGASSSLIKNMFMWQGSFIALIGGGIGLLLGVCMVIGQKQYGWLRLENSIVEAYPVQLQFTDILITLSTLFVLGYIISLYPANKASKVTA